MLPRVTAACLMLLTAQCLLRFALPVASGTSLVGGHTRVAAAAMQLHEQHTAAAGSGRPAATAGTAAGQASRSSTAAAQILPPPHC